MDVERVRAIVKKFAYLEETVQWGENLVFWVGDKAIGGKMFALVNMDKDGKAVMSFSAGPERYAELLEIEGVIPAPYMARIHWVALENWNALDARQLAELLAAAHALTYAKLPARTRDVLALPAAERRRLVAQRRETLAVAKKAKDTKGAASRPAALPKSRKKQSHQDLSRVSSSAKSAGRRATQVDLE